MYEEIERVKMLNSFNKIYKEEKKLLRDALFPGENLKPAVQYTIKMTTKNKEGKKYSLYYMYQWHYLGKINNRSKYKWISLGNINEQSNLRSLLSPTNTSIDKLFEKVMNKYHLLISHKAKYQNSSYNHNLNEYYGTKADIAEGNKYKPNKKEEQLKESIEKMSDRLVKRYRKELEGMIHIYKKNLYDQYDYENNLHRLNGKLKLLSEF
ncbi:hypothetical protein [Thalassobacillus devorans]|nr:hypothetical protein [Thalassobacillus devorans]